MNNSYAVVKLGASQHKLSIGDLVVTDVLDHAVGDKFRINEVYLLVNDGKVTVGAPKVDSAVEFEVVSHGKGVKVRIHKFKAKSRYHKTTGYRSSQTTLKVLSIEGIKESEKAKVESEKVETVEEKSEGKVATKKATAVKAKTAAK